MNLQVVVFAQILKDIIILMKEHHMKLIIKKDTEH
jgi:hypothetical protein